MQLFLYKYGKAAQGMDLCKYLLSKLSGPGDKSLETWVKLVWFLDSRWGISNKTANFIDLLVKLLGKIVKGKSVKDNIQKRSKWSTGKLMYQKYIHIKISTVKVQNLKYTGRQWKCLRIPWLSRFHYLTIFNCAPLKLKFELFG